MNEQQDLKELLLQTDEEFHQLAAKHHELDDRLHNSPLSLTFQNPNSSKKST